MGVNVGEASVAYPFSLFQSVPVVNDTVDSQDVVIFYAPETRSHSRDARFMRTT